MVLNRVNTIGFAVSTEKSVLCKNLMEESVEVLGFQISHNKIEITEKRRKNVLEVIKRPNNVKQLQKIMGQVNYLRHLLKPVHLHCLAKLPTKMKGKKLVWDEEGDQCLEVIKNGLATSDMAISIPPEDSLNIIFSDSSEIAVAGILFFVPLSNFDLEDNSNYKVFPIQEIVKDHIDRYDIICSGITDTTNDILKFCYDAYYTYTDSTIPSYNHVLSKVANQLILSFPEFLPQIICEEANQDNKTILKQIILDLQNKEMFYPYIDNLIILSLSKILRRQILMINVVDGRVNKKPFIKIGFPSQCAPLLIAYSRQGYQLLALEQSYEGQRRFAKITLDRMTNQAVLKLFQSHYKEGKFHYGGSFSKKISASHAHSPIFVKELLALTASLTYFDEYLKLSQTLAVIDSSTISHSLKTFKSRDNTKMFRIGLNLQANFPRLQFVLCPSAQNKADIYTRFFEEDAQSKHLLPREIELCDIKNYIRKLIKDEDLEINNDKTVHFVSPITFDCSLGKLATIDKIRDANILYHSDKLEDAEQYVNKNGVLFKNNKIVLPPSLYEVYILKEHVSLGHIGQERILDHLRHIFFIENLKKIKENIKLLLGACLLCAASKSTFNKNYIWHSKYGFEILKSISIDCIEFQKVTQKRGYFPIKAILIIICNVSKYVSIQFLHNMTTGSIINSFLSYLANHPTPTVVTSDNASNFRNEEMENLFHTFGIRHVPSSPYVSRARGIVERKIKEYREYSRRFALLYPKLRVELAYVFATKVLNNTKLHNIPATPSFLASFQPNSFVYREDYKSNIVNEFTDRLVLHDKGDREKDRINCEEAYANAIKILKDIKEKRLKVVNKNRRKHNFVTDDIVVVRNYARKVKHDELYIYEPHVILKVSGSLVYTQSLITGVVRNRHISHIKRINKLNNLEIPDEILAKNALFNEKLLNDIIKASELPAERSNMRLRKRKDKEIEEERLNEEDLDDLINNYPEVEFELD
jgi:hypothetical protein